MQYFVKRYKLVFVPPALKRLPTQVRVNFIDVTEFLLLLLLFSRPRHVLHPTAF